MTDNKREPTWERANIRPNQLVIYGPNNKPLVVLTKKYGLLPPKGN